MALTETTEFSENKRWLADKTHILSCVSGISVCSSRLGERVRKQSQYGFTLIEALVTLVIVAIAVSVVLESQLVSLKIEQKARVYQLFRFETQRVFSLSRRAKNEAQFTELVSTGGLCRVKTEPVRIESGTNVLKFMKTSLEIETMPSVSSEFFTRQPVQDSSEQAQAVNP